jgi:hypothetical protein
VEACFEEERHHLEGLPPSLFPCYQEARRSVHRDSYGEVAKAYYQVPPEYIGCHVCALGWPLRAHLQSAIGAGADDRGRRKFQTDTASKGPIAVLNSKPVQAAIVAC